MQATSSNNSQPSYEQKQQETHQDDSSQNREQAKHSSLTTQVNKHSMADGDNGVSAPDDKSIKIPLMTPKPLKIPLGVIISDTKQKGTTPSPISPRGTKPLPRLQIPEAGHKEKSPRSPRAELPRNIAENAPQSPGREQIIQMADSVADAYRGFGSPRKEQPKPRRLESRRGLDVTTPSSTLEDADNPQKSNAVTTTTTQITTTTTTTTSTQSTTRSSSVTPSATSDGLLTEPQANFSGSTTQTQIHEKNTADSLIARSGSLPDEPGYQPGEIFIKVRRKISMPKVFVPASDKAVTSSVRPAPDLKYSKESQMAALVDMLVAECTTEPINPNDLGSISQNNNALDIDHLPPELVEFKPSLKSQKKSALTQLIHALFCSEVESSEAWKKAISINQQFNRGGYGWTPSSGDFSGEKLTQLESMLKSFVEDFTSRIFTNKPTLQSFTFPENFKNFLCSADQKFVEKLIDQDRLAAEGNKNFYKLSKKTIDQLRAYFFINILVSRFMKSMLLMDDNSNTQLSSALIQMEIKYINKSALALFSDFQKQSFDRFPEDLQKKIIEKSENEFKAMSIKRGKERFLSIREQSSKRHLRSRSDHGASSNANPLEEKALNEYKKRNYQKQVENLRKQVDEKLAQILVELEVEEFPSSLSKKIDEIKMSWFSVGDEVSNFVIIEKLLQTLRDLIISTGMNSNLMKFETKILEIANESPDMRARRRATMPIRLDDLEFLNSIIGITLNSDESTTTTTNTDLMTTTTTATTATTTMTATTPMTTTGVNPALTDILATLPPTPESIGNERQKNDS